MFLSSKARRQSEYQQFSERNTLDGLLDVVFYVHGSVMRAITKMEGRIMAKVIDANAKLDELLAASAIERSQFEASRLENAEAHVRIEDLLKQLEEAAPEDTQGLIDKMQVELDALKADDPEAPTVPAPAPEAPAEPVAEEPAVPVDAPVEAVAEEKKPE